MEISRRQFGKGALALAGTAPVAAMLTGCPTPTPSQLINELNVVLQEATNLIAVIAPNAPWFQTYKDAVAALKRAEETWQAGGAVSILISALNTVVAVTAVIPETEQYAPLIQVLVAGIVAVLGLLPAPQGVKAQAMHSSPYKGAKTVKSVADSKSQWNAICAANPALGVARL